MLFLKILLQFPEGLKNQALAYAEKYRKEGHEVVLSGSPCYGACDLAIAEAQAIGAEKIVHFGHAPFLRNPPLPVEYIEWHEDVNLSALKQAAASINEKTIALATTVQHIHQIGEMKKIFEDAGKKVLLQKGVYAAYEGQILGCDFGAIQSEKADAAVIVADGKFHALGAFVNYPVYSIHPQTGEVADLKDAIDRAKKIRRGSILRAIGAKNFGVLVSTKPGQFRIKVAEEVARKIREHGKTAEIVIANELSATTLNNFSFDAFVNTACPRIADDVELFGKPIINFDALPELFKLWDDLKSP